MLGVLGLLRQVVEARHRDADFVVCDRFIEVMLVERPMPDAVSVVGVGRRYDVVSTEGGAALEDASGRWP